MLSEIAGVKVAENGISSPSYNLRAMNLKDVAEVEKVLAETILAAHANVDAIEVCFVFECVLVYMPVDASDRLLRLFTDTFRHATVVSYEQVNLNDRFGQVMLDNLVARGCGLDGIDACLSRETQESRFSRTGWSSCSCLNMYSVYLALADRDRIEQLEFLDDVQIFQQLLQHYSISTATK